MGACLGKPQADDPPTVTAPVKQPAYNAPEQQFAQMAGRKPPTSSAPPRPAAPPPPTAEEEHRDESLRAAYSNKLSQKVAAEEEEDEFIPVLQGKEEKKSTPPPVMYGGGAVVDSMSVRGGIRAMGVGSMHGPSSVGGMGGSGRGSSLAMR